jgi:hypothetical protein
MESPQRHRTTAIIAAAVFLPACAIAFVVATVAGALSPLRRPPRPTAAHTDRNPGLDDVGLRLRGPDTGTRLPGRRQRAHRARAVTPILIAQRHRTTMLVVMAVFLPTCAIASAVTVGLPLRGPDTGTRLPGRRQRAHRIRALRNSRT